MPLKKWTRLPERFAAPREVPREMPRDHGAWRLDKAIAGFRRSNDRADRIPPRTRQLQGEPAVSQDELEQIVHEYRHLLEEHRRARPDSRVKRKLEARMARVRLRFDVQLAEAPISESDRGLWRDRLHGDVTQPAATDRVRPPLFRGRSDSGSELQLLLCRDGTLEALVNGVFVVVLDRADELTTTEPGFVFELDGARFRETFAVPQSTLAELRETLEDGGNPRPESVRELIADGLVDRTLNLTSRGRRALALDRLPARHAGAGAGARDQPSRTAFCAGPRASGGSADARHPRYATTGPSDHRLPEPAPGPCGEQSGGRKGDPRPERARRSRSRCRGFRKRGDQPARVPPAPWPAEADRARSRTAPRTTAPRAGSTSRFGLVRR